ncbi:MAG: COX15/CtaA family protein [Oligoflexia bacterium]|nr:COX15/CtaA family protein [Oligoflexia bacterium]
MVLPRAMSRIANWLAALSILIFILLPVGGWVRNIGAGLACPDWPLCFGKLIPHFDIQIFAEFFHRFFAAAISIVFLVAAVWITRDRGLRTLLGRLIVLGAIILAAQIILGGLTVLHLLQSEIVTLHLTFGTLFFVVSLILTLRAYRFGDSPQLFAIARDRKRSEPSMTWRSAVAATVMVFIQIVLGGVVSSNGAGLACPEFPTCINGEWWPGFEGALGIQITHRIGAVLTLLSVVWFVVGTLKDRALPKHIHFKAKASLVVVIIQWAIGIANVLLGIPVIGGVAHLAVAELLLALVLMATYEIRHFELRKAH